MATPSRFSFSGWNSFKLSPQVNPAAVQTISPGLLPPAAPGQLVAQTNAANTNLPAWLQTEVDKLNAQDALRKTFAGAVTGGGGAPAFDPNLGVAAVTNARANFNAQVNQMNEAGRLQNLIQQRNQIRAGGGGAFGFTNPFDTDRLIGLGRQIEDYQNVNLPVSAGIRPMNVSGWTSPNPYRTF